MLAERGRDRSGRIRILQVVLHLLDEFVERLIGFHLSTDVEEAGQIFGILGENEASGDGSSRLKYWVMFDTSAS